MPRRGDGADIRLLLLNASVVSIDSGGSGGGARHIILSWGPDATCWPTGRADEVAKIASPCFSQAHFKIKENS